jgi:hypothetical protein
MIEITRELAARVRDVVDVGLVSGLGVPEPGKLCVEAAVCYALGLPHGDEPTCVSPALRLLKIRLNDSRWSSPQARAQGLRRLAIAQLGSAGVLDDRTFRQRVVDMTIRRAVPIGLRAAARRNPNHAQPLEAAAVRCEQEGSREACLHARKIAYADAADAYAYAAAAYADADAAAAAAYAAYAAAAAATAAAAARTRNRVLAEYAEWVVEILIDLKAPGCEWLDLVPLRRDGA